MLKWDFYLLWLWASSIIMILDKKSVTLSVRSGKSRITWTHSALDPSILIRGISKMSGKTEIRLTAFAGLARFFGPVKTGCVVRFSIVIDARGESWIEKLLNYVLALIKGLFFNEVTHVLTIYDPPTPSVTLVRLFSYIYTILERLFLGIFLLI